MIDTVVNYIGQPVSLFGAWLLVMPLYVIAVIVMTTRDEPDPELEPEPDLELEPDPEPEPELDPEPADWPVDEWPEHDEPGTQPIPAQPSTQPVVATTARSFQLGDDELTFNFRDRA